MIYLYSSVILHLISQIVSTVISQNAIDLPEYCMGTDYCAEGTHVACRYLNQNNQKGSQCVNPVNIDITSHIKNTVLEEVNKIRSKLALGSETGKNDKPLPKAYGMNKMLWDNELAFFAQLWANQCETKKDLCRYTSKFPNPSQIVAEVRFSYPNWDRHGMNFRSDGPQDNVLYAFLAAIKSWYSLKTDVDETMIVRSDHPEQWENQPINDYLAMVHDDTTHMGCGVSAFTKEIFSRTKSGVYNVILVVCNFDSQPENAEPIYALENKNIDSRCGCPKGAVEDFDCLCNGAPEKKEIYHSTKKTTDANPHKKTAFQMSKIGKYIVDSMKMPKIGKDQTEAMKLILKVKSLEQPITKFLKMKLANITHITNPEEVYNYIADPNNLPDANMDGVEMTRPIKAIIMSTSDFEDSPSSKEYSKKALRSSEMLQHRFFVKPSSRKALYPSADLQEKTSSQPRPVIFHPSESKGNYNMYHKHHHRRVVLDDDDSSKEIAPKMNAKYKYQTDIARKTKEGNYKKQILPVKRKTLDMTSNNNNDRDMPNQEFHKSKHYRYYNTVKPEVENYTRIISLLNDLEEEMMDMHSNDLARRIVDERIKKIYNKVVSPKNPKSKNIFLESNSIIEPKPKLKIKPSITNPPKTTIDVKNVFSKYVNGFQNKTAIDDRGNSAMISFEELIKGDRDDSIIDNNNEEYNRLSDYFHGKYHTDKKKTRFHVIKKSNDKT